MNNMNILDDILNCERYPCIKTGIVYIVESSSLKSQFKVKDKRRLRLIQEVVSK